MRIYSRSLTQVEIEKAMHDLEIGSHPAGKAAHALAGEILDKRLTDHTHRCHRPTRDEDTLVPGLMVAVGMLSALACVGFWPGHRLPVLGVSLTVGLLLVPAAAITLPPYVLWTLPPLSLAGAHSVAISLSAQANCPSRIAPFDESRPNCQGWG